jgi:hypothetical protein
MVWQADQTDSGCVEPLQPLRPCGRDASASGKLVYAYDLSWLSWKDATDRQIKSNWGCATTLRAGLFKEAVEVQLGEPPSGLLGSLSLTNTRLQEILGFTPQREIIGNHL